MSVTTNTTLGSLADNAKEVLYRPAERPLLVDIGTDALTDNSSDVELTLANADETVSPSDLLEFGYELLLVRSKTAVADPVYTVARGYLSTDVAAHATGTIGLKNPPWTRHQIRKTILQFVEGSLNTWLPNMETLALSVGTSNGVDQNYITLPADTVHVRDVRHVSTISGRITTIGGWRHEPNLPTDDFATGNVLRVPTYITSDDELLVTVQSPWRWYTAGGVEISDGTVPDDDGYIPLPYNASDLPALYTVAWLAAGREITRLQLDTVEEWNWEHSVRQGQNARTVRDAWGTFYRRLEEARRDHMKQVPQTRVFRKLVKA